MYSFEKMEVWQLSRQFVTSVYRIISDFPHEEKYSLCDQIKRAAISVPSNIAEGMSRYSNKEKIHFLEISNGSLMETMCQLEIANRLGYISNDDFRNMETSISEIACMLSTLRKKIVLQTNSSTTN